MSDKPTTGIVFPPPADDEFRKHVVLLADDIAKAVGEYVSIAKDSTIGPPSADAIGAACFVAALQIAMSFDDARQEQTIDALLGMAAINIPPTDVN